MEVNIIINKRVNVYKPKFIKEIVVTTATTLFRKHKYLVQLISGFSHLDVF